MAFLLPHLVDEAAERDSSREAIVCLDQALTYGALCERANQLAHVLVEQGVRRGDRVGILMRKSVDVAVALHGIMKAGAAYVPLDPAAPPERCAFVLNDCGVRHLVTADGCGDDLAAIADAGRVLDCVISLPSGSIVRSTAATQAMSWADVSAAPTTAPQISGLMEQDLAYVLYTSGSTGVPKGIMHTHHSALSFADAAVTNYGLQSQDRVSNHAPLHFDLSTLDYFGVARAGATTVVIPELYTKLPASLSQLMEDARLSVLYCVPFALTQLCLGGAIDQRDLSALRLILFGGEPMPIKHLHTLMGLLPHVQFCNIYGPTETNGCTDFFVPPGFTDSEAPLPIGKPYRNAEVMVMDEHDAEAPCGIAGELLVRAPTMMRGYWGRDDLNATAFYNRPSHPGCTDVFHRTGDVVRRDADGTLWFLGRKDRQMKVRGNRIELDEVEAVLLSHPSLAEAVVFTAPDASGVERILAAAITNADSQPIDAETLRSHCATRLAPYAVPESIDLPDELPRTATGKVDRVRLRAVASAASPGDRANGTRREQKE